MRSKQADRWIEPDRQAARRRPIGKVFCGAIAFEPSFFWLPRPASGLDSPSYTSPPSLPRSIGCATRRTGQRALPVVRGADSLVCCVADCPVCLGGLTR